MAASAWGSLSGANVLIWIGIALCITQSAILSGLNLAIFSISNRDRRRQEDAVTHEKAY